MSVQPRKLASGATRHEVRWREGDKHKARLFDSRKAALAFDKEIRRIRQAGELAVEMDRRRVTINDLYVEWLDRSQPNLSKKAAANYGLQLDLRVLPEFGERRVAQITIADVERWIARMRRDGAGDPTIIKASTVLQALLSMAVRDGTVTVNVAQQARKPKQGRTRVPYLVKPLDVELMRAHLEARGRLDDIVLLELLAYAGLRPESEAVTLTWTAARDRSLVIRDTKRNRERTVVLLEPVAQTLADARRRGRGDLVVPKKSGEWTEHDWRNWRRRVFLPAALSAGLPADLRPRDLRGSFVSLLVHEGRSIIEVARQVGHSPAICLRDYGQVFDEMDPFNRQSAAQIIAHARLAVRIARMRDWAVTVPDEYALGTHEVSA